jgi:hypothetical protein
MEHSQKRQSVSVEQLEDGLRFTFADGTTKVIPYLAPVWGKPEEPEEDEQKQARQDRELGNKV